MTLQQFIKFSKRYLASIVGISLLLFAAGLCVLFISRANPTYTATAVSYMEVSTAKDYEPDQSFDHVTRSQLANQKMNNYEALYTAEETIQSVVDALQLDYTPEVIRSATTLTTDPEKLTETVEVTLDNSKDAVAVANGLIEVTARKVADIEGEDTFVINNIEPASEENVASSNARLSKKRLALLLLVSVFIAFGQAFYRYAHDTRIFRVNDIQRVSDIPVLAVLPTDNRTEAISHIRSSILQSPLDTAPIEVLGLSDSHASSVLARDIAQAFAASGRSVVLVDANETASSTKEWGAADKSGLTDLSRTEVSDVSPLATPIENLSIVPLGTRALSVADALASPAVISSLMALASSHTLVLDTGSSTIALPQATRLIAVSWAKTTCDDIVRITNTICFTHEENSAFILDNANFSPWSRFRFGNPGSVDLSE